MLIYNDLISGKDICTDSYPCKVLFDGAIMSVESKKVQVGGEEINIGGNASKEEEEEKLEDEVKTVINIVEAHSLQKMELDVKEYKTLQNAYWKQLLDAINQQKIDLLFEGKAPAKEEAKAAETAAVAKLNKADKTKYEAILAQIEKFKKNFKVLQDFVKDEIVKNFKEFDFYIPAEPTILGKSMLVPARWVGDATAPVFYLFTDGIVEEKA